MGTRAVTFVLTYLNVPGPKQRLAVWNSAYLQAVSSSPTPPPSEVSRNPPLLHSPPSPNTELSLGSTGQGSLGNDSLPSHWAAVLIIKLSLLQNCVSDIGFLHLGCTDKIELGSPSFFPFLLPFFVFLSLALAWFS